MTYLFAYALSVILAIPGTSSVRQGIPIPAVLGEHDQAVIVSEIEIPTVPWAYAGLSACVLEMSGTQVTGLRNACDLIPVTAPSGAMIRVTACSIDDPAEIDVAEFQLPAIDGPWVVSVDFEPTPGQIPALGWWGTVSVTFEIGILIPEDPCEETIRLPVVDIEAARVYRHVYLPGETVDWGELKVLYH